MKSLFYLLILFLISSLNLTAQITCVGTSVLSQKLLGGNKNDRAYATQQCTDGGFILAGSSASNDGDVTGNHGGLDFWIVKTDENGIIEWQRSYGGSLDDEARSIALTNDGGYIVAGYVKSIDGNVTGHHSNKKKDFWVIKLDGNGNLLWQKALGGNDDDDAQSVIQISNGSFIVAGSSLSKDGDVTQHHKEEDFWVVKVNESGTLVWQKSLGGSRVDVAKSVVETSDGNYVVTGYTQSTDDDVAGNHGSFDFWTVKLNTSGGLLWSKTMGGANADQANTLIKTDDGGLIIAGYAKSNDGDVTTHYGGADYWVIKTDGDGTIQWQKAFGGNADDIPNAMVQLAGGGYLVAGSSASLSDDVNKHYMYPTESDGWIIRIDGSGNLIWTQVLGGSETDVFNSILQTPDGRYIAAGSTDSKDYDVTAGHGNNDYWFLKLDTVALPTAYYEDADGDGYGSISAIALYACTAPPGSVTDHTDCNDANKNIHPSNLETCNGIDDDCDGITDISTLFNNNAWVRIYGGTEGDNLNDIVHTDDGGVLITGYTESNNKDIKGNHGLLDAVVIKVNAEGSIEWQKCYGGSGDDGANAVTSAGDGGFVIAGFGESADGDVTGNNGTKNCWVFKIDATGNLQWQVSFGVLAAKDITRSPDGGYLVGSNSFPGDIDASDNHGDYDYWITKLNADGQILWKKSFGGVGTDFLTSLIATPGGGCIAGGKATGDGDMVECTGSNSFWIIKLDADGNQKWQQCAAPTQQAYTFPKLKIAPTQDGGFITAAEDRTILFNIYYNFDYSVSKYNKKGNLQWQKYFGGSGEDNIADLVQLPNQHYVVTGTSSSDDYDVTTHHKGSSSDLWTIELDENGNLLADNSLYSIDHDRGTAIDVTTEGGVITAGNVSTFDFSAYDTAYIGNTDLLVAKFGPQLTTPATYYADADGDYYGNASSSITSCSQPLGYVKKHNDCNDANPLIYPGAVEYLNDEDDNCDGIIDENGSCPAPYNAVTSMIGSSSALLTWNDVISPDKFIVDYKISGAASWTKLSLNGSTYSVTLSGLAPNTTYKWRVRAKCNGVSSDFTDVLTFSTLLRIQGPDGEASSEINLYPNPADNSLWIDLHTIDIRGLSIYNELGQEVLQRNSTSLDSSPLEVNITPLYSGVYFVHLNLSDGTIVVKKFVKQ